MREHTHAGDRWMPEADYQFVCARVPILCVDLLIVVPGTGRFGLIERDTYDGGRGLNLVGGRVLLDEPLDEAVHRHLRATLGSATRLRTGSLAQVGVYQYFKEPREGQLHDPRKNAVSVTYTGVLEGQPTPEGEAHAFHTFELARPPALAEFGFGQGSVVYEALASLRAGGGLASSETTRR